MKYKQFREYLTFYRIPLKEDDERLIVGLNYVEISKVEEHSIIISLASVEDLEELELIKKAIELAETPLQKRGDKTKQKKQKKKEIKK